MDTSLRSYSPLNPKFLARWASLIAHKLGYKETDDFRASLLAVLEGKGEPLSVGQLAVIEDLLTSPLGWRALAELNHVRYCDFDNQRIEHEDAVQDLLHSEVEKYPQHPGRTTQNIRLILAEWAKNIPQEPHNIWVQELHNLVIQRQKESVANQMVKLLLESIRWGTAQKIYTFPSSWRGNGGESLYYDPKNYLLGIADQTCDTILGNDVIRWLVPTWQAEHLCSESQSLVCTDVLQWETHIVQFFQTPINSSSSDKFLSIIPPDDIIETRNLVGYGWEPIFLAHVQEEWGGSFVISSKIKSYPCYAPASLHEIDGDCLVVSIENWGYFVVIRSALTGQEIMESWCKLITEWQDLVLQHQQEMEFTFSDCKISSRWGWFGRPHTLRVSELVKVWKKIYLKEAGKK